MSQTFVERYTNFLKDRKPKEALELFTIVDDKVIEDSASEIVSVTAGYLTEHNSEREEKLFKCCKAVLNIIAERCNPMETVLEFLEHIEYLDNDVKFYAMLESLGICMTKMQDKGKTIEWCVSTIKSYVEDLPSPNINADPDAVSDRIMNVYIEIVSFLEPLVQETVKINSKFEEESLLGECLLSLLISLCGKPFCYLSKNVIEKMTYIELWKKIITLSICLTGDIFYLSDIVSKRHRNIIRNEAKERNICTKSHEHSIFLESSENVSSLAYANFYLHIITNENHWKNVPQVYSPYYIFEISTYFFETLFRDEEEILVSKGLIFMEDIIKRISPYSIDFEALELRIYSDLFKPIIKVMIYCSTDTERKKAIHVFHEYIKIFNLEARYSIILYLYGISEHSGLLSLITGVFKSSIIECLDSNPQNLQFLGKNMELILKKVCDLPYGSSSDLIEISDEVTAALNLLRFLFIRDKLNQTGIWNLVDTLRNNYLDPLRNGIDICRAHWRVKLKDLEQQRKYYTKIHSYEEMKKVDAEVTLTVGGEQLPVMPIPEKIYFCHQAINSLDLMESILIRVNECIEVDKESAGK